MKSTIFLMPDTLFYQYRVERINHNERHLFFNLFNQYEIFRGETPFEESARNFIGKRLDNCEPVLYIVFTNYPASIPVGFIQLYSLNSSANTARTTVVSDLFVLPDYRNNGIALKLIEAAVKFAAGNKSAEIQLETSQGNRVAQKLYESVGFKRQNISPESAKYYIKLAGN